MPAMGAVGTTTTVTAVAALFLLVDDDDDEDDDFAVEASNDNDDGNCCITPKEGRRGTKASVEQLVRDNNDRIATGTFDVRENFIVIRKRSSPSSQRTRRSLR
jgi:hypothetical protein